MLITNIDKILGGISLLSKLIFYSKKVYLYLLNYLLYNYLYPINYIKRPFLKAIFYIIKSIFL